MKQKVTVYDSKGKKISAKHYTVTYSEGTIRAGKVKVTVKMDECYGSKKLTTKYTIKVNSKTAKLFPKRTYFKYVAGTGGYIGNIMDGKKSSSFSYTKQSSKFMKQLLPYGNLDVEEDLVDYIPAVNNRTLFKEDDYFIQMTGPGDALKFTGTIGDLIQCYIQSKISKVEKDSKSVEKKYYVTCVDGTEYEVEYLTKFQSMKSGYVGICLTRNATDDVYAYIKP
jgi:hypothetical protein